MPYSISKVRCWDARQEIVARRERKKRVVGYREMGLGEGGEKERKGEGKRGRRKLVKK